MQYAHDYTQHVELSQAQVLSLSPLVLGYLVMQCNLPCTPEPKVNQYPFSIGVQSIRPRSLDMAFSSRDQPRQFKVAHLRTA